MGLGPRISSCGNDRPQMGRVVIYGQNDPELRRRVDELERKLAKPLPNPNKFRWTIEQVQRYATGWTVVILTYPDCTNYEGRKVLVYDDYAKFDKLRAKGELDPHFNNESYSPVARFEPTPRGIKLAKRMASRGDRG